MAADRKRISIAPLGIDTSTPDTNVKDGKCAKLHNLRYSAGAWRNVHDFTTLHHVDSMSDIRIVYHHPADDDNRYIAECRNEITETYYEWIGSTVYYTLVAPDDIKVGDVLYDRPDLEHDPNYFEKTDIRVSKVNRNNNTEIEYTHITGSVSTPYYAWIYANNDYSKPVYTENASPQNGDSVFSISNNTATQTGKIQIGENGKYYVIALDGTGIGAQIERAETGDTELKDFVTETTILTYNHSYTATRRLNSFCVVEIGDGILTIVQELQKIIEPYTISHFGKVLIILDHANRNLIMYMFTDNSRYVMADISGSMCKLSINLPNVLNERVSTAAVKKTFGNLTLFGEKICSSGKTDVYFTNAQDGLWRGEIGIFAAVRTKDNKIIYTTPLQILNTAQKKRENSYSYPDKQHVQTYIEDDKSYVFWGNEYDINGFGAGNNIYAVSGVHIFTYADVAVDIPIELQDSTLIDNIGIYCTRLHPLFVFDTTTGLSKSDFISKTEIANELFYLLKSIDIKDFKVVDNDVCSNNFEIRYSDLVNIEHSTIYEPTQTINNIFGTNLLEYNNRLHIFGTTYKPSVLDAQSILLDVESEEQADDNTYRRCVIIEYRRNDVVYSSIFTMSDFSRKFPFKNNNILAASKNQGLVLTFPGEINSISFAGEAGSGRYVISKKYSMKYSSTLNISYYTSNREDRPDRYEDIVLPDASEVTNNPQNIIDTKYIDEPNRVQASDNNNCFVFPFENSYRIGTQSNNIIAANSAAIEMSDSKFGEFPLYIFTDEGIFSMQSGNDTLYSAVIPIAYDRAINPNTLAVNYNVLFVSARGLMALSARGLVCLSEELNTADNLIPECLRTAKLVRLPKYNEVMVVNDDSQTSHIYSLDNKVWSSRSISTGTILNNDEMVVADGEGCKIIDITDESNDMTAPIEYEIDTRSIKFGTTELKRLETIAVRFESESPQRIGIEVYGKTNRNDKWIRLRYYNVVTNKDIIIRRTPLSVKYLRFRIFGTATEDVKILYVDNEYYLRMVHRLR